MDNKTFRLELRSALEGLPEDKKQRIRRLCNIRVENIQKQITEERKNYKKYFKESLRLRLEIIRALEFYRTQYEPSQLKFISDDIVKIFLQYTEDFCSTLSDLLDD